MRRVRKLLFWFGVLAAGAAAAEYSSDWGPPLNQPLPLLEAPDHTGALRSLDNLARENGLLIFLNRSADW